MPTSNLLAALVKLFAVVVLMVIAGCNAGDGITRYQVTGSITFNGKPVPAGQITFEPDAQAGNKGATGYAMIVDGKYDTSAQDGAGVIGGPMIVRISGSEPSSDPSKGGKTLFYNYEEKADLLKSTTTKDFVVPPSAAAPDQPAASAVP